MKILIHTLFYQNYNYGGILQAYALYSFLENEGHECIELNYQQGGNRLQWFVRRLKNVFELILNPSEFNRKRVQIIGEKDLQKKYTEEFREDLIKSKFDEFMKENFKQTKVYNSGDINHIEELYDCCVIGGDQMWNPMWYDKNFYLAFSKSKNIAYSCSIGKDYLSLVDEKKILNGIKYIDCISVREKNIVTWFEERNVHAELVCDPVFLLSGEDWKNFAEDSISPKEEYLFAYLLGDGKEIRQQVRKLANQLGVKLVLIPHVRRRYNEYDVNLADYSPMDVGPREFVGLIKNARYVATDSFHGTAFSIILDKDFVSINRFAKEDKEALNSRVESILDVFDMRERLVGLESVGALQKDYFDRCKRVEGSSIREFSLSGKRYLDVNL